MCPMRTKISKLRQNITFLCCLLCLTNLLFTQNSEPQLRVNLVRQNNFTLQNQYQFRLKKQFKKYSLDVQTEHDHIYNTLLEKPFVQLYFNHQLWQYYQLSPKWKLVSYLDGQQFLHNQNYRFTLYKGVSYQPNEHFSLTPMLGYSWDLLNQRLNHGIAPALIWRSQHRLADGTELESQFTSRIRFISPRLQQNIKARLGLAKTFENQANLSLQLLAGIHENDNFKSKSVERIITDSLGAALALQYPILPQLMLESQNEWLTSYRRFRYKTTKDSLPEFNNTAFLQHELRSRQQLQWKHKSWSAQAAYGYEWLLRDYSIENNTGLNNLAYKRLEAIEEMKSFVRQSHQIDFQVDKKMGKHQANLRANNKYILYDTPSAENYDDHDELLHQIITEVKSFWTPAFTTRYMLEGNRRQYAFLFKEKSRDNYTQYLLRLEFDSRWRPSPRWDVKTEQWIYVTYNVRDFEDITFSNRSTRNLESRFSISHQPNDKWSQLLSFYRRETQLSYLNWEAFSETTLDTTLTYIVELKNEKLMFENSKQQKIWLSFGYKHFQLSKYQNSFMYDLNNILVPINLHKRNIQTGPVFGIKSQQNQGFSVDSYLWGQLQRNDNAYRKTTANPPSLQNFQESDLQRVDQALRPYWEVRINWWF